MQIPPPQNWQDFESLCCDLWSRVWNDRNTQKNGRNGQSQCGVDIVGRPSNSSGKYHGIQCKGKDNYSSNIITIGELEEEVAKASKFSPCIESFLIATTSRKDVHIEKRAREITEENRKKGLFSVHVFGWADIVGMLSEYPDVLNKYYSWATKINDPNQVFFDFWLVNADVKNLKVNANIIPFQSFNVRFSGRFLNLLDSYLLKIETYLRTMQQSQLNRNLKEAVVNFNQIANDVLKVCYKYENRYDIQSDIYTYWVDTENLPYHECGQFISFRKHVLKVLFYNLVKSANYVIYIRNALFPNSSNALGFISFIDDFNYNFPLFGNPHPSPEYYPIYSETEIEEVGLYQGLEKIEDYVRAQVYGS